MEIKPVKEWSAAIMINHWAMALSIFVLIVTGFYIADPCTIYQGETVDKFFVGNMRYVHILFGIFLMFIFIWRLYLAFFSRFHADWKDFFAAAKVGGLKYIFVEMESNHAIMEGCAKFLKSLG